MNGDNAHAYSRFSRDVIAATLVRPINGGHVDAPTQFSVEIMLKNMAVDHVIAN